MKRALSYIVIVTLFATMWVGVANVEAKTIKKAGWYYSDLRKTLSDGKLVDSEFPKMNTCAKKIVLNKNKLTIFGSVGTLKIKKSKIKGKSYDILMEQGVKYKVGKKVFKISKKCKFYKQEKNDTSKKISFKKLKKLALPLKKGSVKNYHQLCWKVKGGKIVRMDFDPLYD